MPLASTIELPDRYRVSRHIASGGMASVWEAEDLVLGRIVAVKVLDARYACDPGARARFQREARTAARVSHQSHVVTIYDIGEHRDEAFIVMEHFAGGTVADRLQAAREGGAAIPRRTALRWCSEAAAGLDVAHDAQIVHRDVKPANLLLDAQDRLAVADFGIARLADDTRMTQTGQVIGTAAYISPEQALGQPATPASDRYALAVVAYELLTGTRPFAGGSPTAQALAHARDEPPRASVAAPGLAPAIDPVFARGLAKDPDARPASAREFVTAITGALQERSSVAPTRPIAAAPPAARAAAGPPPAREPAPKPAASRRPRPAPVLLGAILLVCAVVALGLALSNGSSPQPRAGAGAGSSRTTADKPSTAATPEPAPQTSAEPGAEPGAETQAPKQDAEPQGESPEALNNRGKALSDDGSYAQAVAPLRAAVDGYKAAGETELPYAYALYNLAVALNRSGQPQQAVPLLRERLRFNDQTEAVQAELDDALSKLDPDPAGAKAQKRGNKQAKQDKPAKRGKPQRLNGGR